MLYVVNTVHTAFEAIHLIDSAYAVIDLYVRCIILNIVKKEQSIRSIANYRK